MLLLSTHCYSVDTTMHEDSASGGIQGACKASFSLGTSSEDKTKTPTSRQVMNPSSTERPAQTTGLGTSVFRFLDRTTGDTNRIIWDVAVMARTVSRSRPSERQIWPSAPCWQSCRHCEYMPSKLKSTPHLKGKLIIDRTRWCNHSFRHNGDH